MRVKTACNVIVFCGDKVLLGKRRKGYAKGFLSLPGGHLIAGESFVQCASRELFEEVGLFLKRPTFFTSIEEREGKNIFFHLFFFSEVFEEDFLIQNKEPCNFSYWGLFTPGEVFDKIIKIHGLALKQIKKNNFFTKIW